jgi:hypothetical protein
LKSKEDEVKRKQTENEDLKEELLHTTDSLSKKQQENSRLSIQYQTCQKDLDDVQSDLSTCTKNLNYCASVCSEWDQS